MAWHQQDNIDLRNFSTMHIGGIGKKLITTDNPADDLEEIFSSAISPDNNYQIVGEGSNSIFAGDFPDKTFIQLKNNKIQILKETDSYSDLIIGGGCSWDNLVQFAVENNLHGIEMMSAIPGTVGAAPIQNIGAYGGEFSDTCLSISAFDTTAKQTTLLQKSQCSFGYRTSIFKHNPERYIVIEVSLRLHKKSTVTIPEYPGIAEYLQDNNIMHPTIQDIRNTITDIRWGKLPRPSELPNCGSFFKNAITTKEHRDELVKAYPDLKSFDLEDGLVKIPTGWLIDSLNLKGYRIGDIGIYEKHALVIVNYGDGTILELFELIASIQEKIYATYQISIEIEVNIIMPTSSSRAHSPGVSAS